MKARETYTQLQKKIWDIHILAVTKYQSDEVTLQAVQDWIWLIGESKVQDAKRKYALLKDAWLDFRMHMIWHLQTNKLKDALQVCDVIQSVDSEKLMRKIHYEMLSQSEASSETPHTIKQQEVYLQLNLTGESQKYGFTEQQIWRMVDLCDMLQWVHCTWLMCMWMLWDPERTRSIYKKCRSLCDIYELEHCSMGMSDDREIAIQEGSTMLRLGSALFS